MNNLSDFRKHFSALEENILISNRVESSTGGIADYFICIDEIKNFIELLQYLTVKKRDFAVIGSGSKTIISQFGYSGVLIKNQSAGCVIVQQLSQITVEAGMAINALVNKTAEVELSGLEFMAQKHGTMGGWLLEPNSINFNRISEYVKSITVFYRTNNKILHFSGQWLKDNLKSLRDPNNQSKPIILNVRLQLSRSKKESVLAKMNIYSKKNQFKNTKTGFIENIFEELFTQTDRLRLTKFFPPIQNATDNEILATILKDSDIVRKITSEIEFIFSPNNIILLKKPVEHQILMENIDSIIQAVYDKFGVLLNKNVSILGLP